MRKKIGCVIMASGKSTRFGKNKLIEDFHGKTLIQHILDKTEDMFDRRVVVTRSPEVELICKEQNIEVVFHAFPNRNDAVKLGVQKMDGMDACIFCPCDQPLLLRASIEDIIARKIEDHTICRLAYEEQVGTPILFGKKYFEELLHLPEKKGGSFLAKKYPESVTLVQAQSERELFDIDTPEDYQNAMDFLN